MKVFTALLSLSLLLSASINGLSSVHSFKLELIHRDAVSGGDGLLSGGDVEEKIKALHRRDVARSRRRRAAETGSGASVAMPMHSGADYGTGEYFVHVRVGSPGQKFMLVADTGSDLTWINCRYGCGGRRCGTHKGRLSNGKRVFRADRSSTFRTISCSSRMCKVDLSNLFSLTTCPTPFTPCAYDYRYLEGSAAIGFFANETVSVGLTNGRKRRLNNVLVGCTESARGADQGGFKAADGVLGLGFGSSFASRAARDFGGKFSYCLVDHLSPKNVSSFVVFGQERIETSLLGGVQHTELVLGDVYGPLYGVAVSGISVGAQMLEIPSRVWDPALGGGTILDSGTSLTFLAEPAYGLVTAELRKYTSSRGGGGGLSADADGGPFEFCFNSTGFDEGSVPRLRVHFADGAVFEPPVKSYVIDVAPQKKCLGFVSASWPGTSIIGNIMQQNHLWEFDLVQSKLGFAPSSCT